MQHIYQPVQNPEQLTNQNRKRKSSAALTSVNNFSLNESLMTQREGCYENIKPGQVLAHTL